MFRINGGDCAGFRDKRAEDNFVGGDFQTVLALVAACAQLIAYADFR